MSFKTVYQMDAQGIYIGEADAQEDPLEPGSYLIPGGCVELSPPTIKKGYIAVWRFDQNIWEQVFVKPEEPLPASLDSEEVVERVWRDGELKRADIELNKSQDGDGFGTVKQWRDYRKALRAYPSVEGFPSSGLRPVAPDRRTGE